jgi:RNA polymerase sigma-70 factor (ECF subfamily)
LPDRASRTPPREASDERRLVEGMIAGDPAAISEFLDRSHNQVFFMSCRLTGDRHLRRDWTHDVLLGVIDDLRNARFEYRGPGSFWGWFRKRAHYRLLDERRRDRKRRDREIAGDAGEEAIGLSGIASGGDPAGEVERAELLDAFEECLARLPSDQQRRALRLRLLDDASYQEIAAAMSSPLNTVRAWIRRARLAVRKCLLQAMGGRFDG